MQRYVAAGRHRVQATACAQSLLVQLEKSQNLGINVHMNNQGGCQHMQNLQLHQHWYHLPTVRTWALYIYQSHSCYFTKVAIQFVQDGTVWLKGSLCGKFSLRWTLYHRQWLSR